MSMSLRIVLALCAVLMSACNEGHDQLAGVQPAVVSEPATAKKISYSNSAGHYRAVVHAPAGRDETTPLPLLVMVHGCSTNAEQQQAANLLDPLADREGFIVIYPDHDTTSLASPGTHPLQCWRFYNPIEAQRDIGDVDAIAGLTRLVMKQHLVDPERVYLMGMSSGGFLASMVGATYPDLFAAIGLSAGGPYGLGGLGLYQPIGAMLMPTEALAQLAYKAMGEHARVMPMLSFHGDKDGTVPPNVGTQAIQQWLMTNNLIVSGNTAEPFPLVPTETRAISQRGSAYSYDVDVYRDAAGCTLVQQVRIHGMDHFWPGGSSDPALAAFTDPLGPNGAEMAWDFFRHYRKSDTGLPCVESKL